MTRVVIRDTRPRADGDGIESPGDDQRFVACVGGHDARRVVVVLDRKGRLVRHIYAADANRVVGKLDVVVVASHPAGRWNGAKQVARAGGYVRRRAVVEVQKHLRRGPVEPDGVDRDALRRVNRTDHRQLPATPGRKRNHGRGKAGGANEAISFSRPVALDAGAIQAHAMMNHLHPCTRQSPRPRTPGQIREPVDCGGLFACASGRYDRADLER